LVIRAYHRFPVNHQRVAWRKWRDGRRLRPQAEPARYRISITGDTLVYDDIKEIPRHYPDIALALLHLDGTEVLGIMVTMDGKQGVEMLQVVDPNRAIPIHFNDYDGFKSPLSDFEQEVKAAGLDQRVHSWHHGDTCTVEARSRRRHRRD
jgi:L-ascorbate metabolism protein UlaG (beta-lactamase superfamily)